MTGTFIDPLNQQISSSQVRTELFTSNGTWTKPNGCNRIWITMCGAGGDGASAAGSGGGGAGAYCINIELPVDDDLDIFCGTGSDSYISEDATGNELLRAKKGVTSINTTGGVGGGWGQSDLGSGAGGVSGSPGVIGTVVLGDIKSGFYGGSGGGGATSLGGGINGGLGVSPNQGGGGGDLFGRGGAGGLDPGGVGQPGNGYGSGGGGGDSSSGGTGAPGFVLIKYTKA